MSTRWFVGLSLAAAIACVATLTRAGEGDNEFKSGLQPGENPSAFQCRDITGPNKGKSLCYV
jgi:hypothetical protein